MFLKQQSSKALGSQSYEAAIALASSPEAAPSRTLPLPAEQPLPIEQPENLPRWVPAAPEEADSHMDGLAALDLTALQEANPDVVGWILIPDTRINYPLLQGEDNDYYLDHTWDHKRYDVGSIFLECLNSPDFTDFNTILYGHNMNDGSMFAGIRLYRTEQYLEDHPYVYLRNDRGVFRYEIFASYLADAEGYSYCMDFPQEADRKAFLDRALADSVIQTGILPEPTDRILTLSTCSGRGYSTRWVLHARLKMVSQDT